MLKINKDCYVKEDDISKYKNASIYNINLSSELIKVENNIAIKTKRGPSNYIVISQNVSNYIENVKNR